MYDYAMLDAGVDGDGVEMLKFGRDEAAFPTTNNPMSSEAAATCPRGWRERTNADGQTHFVNVHTQEITRETPSLPAPPAGWTVHPHAEHGQYYHNEVTGEAVWSYPEADGGDDGTGDAAGAAFTLDDESNPMHQRQALGDVSRSVTTSLLYLYTIL